MRILIVAPSITRAVDGVADYSENLARALMARGHEAMLVGLNEFHEGGTAWEKAEGGIARINVSAYEDVSTRLARVGERIRKFAPEAVIVQYYWRGFWVGKKQNQLAAFLREMGGSARRVIMYHEVWEEVGTKSRLPRWLRHGFVGAMMAIFQRTFAPHSVFTNTQLYARQLRWLGARAEVVPVPSNMPVVPREPQAEAAVWAQVQAGGLGPVAREEVWAAVFFGRLPPEWPAEEVMPWLQQALAASGRARGVILSIGKTAYGDAGWVRVKQAAEQLGWATVKLGMQSEETVSRVLSVADMGVVTTRGQLLEKSGTFAAMVEHGLPVFTLDAKELPLVGNAGVFVVPGEGFAASLKAAVRRAPVASAWGRLCERFEGALGLVS